jgi:hypothetical protein
LSKLEILTILLQTRKKKTNVESRLGGKPLNLGISNLGGRVNPPACYPDADVSTWRDSTIQAGFEKEKGL